MFIKAKPIWLKDKECEQNYFAAFEATVKDLKSTEIHIAAATFYRLFVNGTFVAFGPARTAAGYARKDVISLDAYHLDEGNAIRIEVAGYCCGSYSAVKSTSFLLAEIRKKDEIIAFTGRDFIGARMWEKVQAVERYSMQRHFGEIWDEVASVLPSPETVTLDLDISVIDRIAPYPRYDDVLLNKACLCGTFAFDESLPFIERNYNPTSNPEVWGRFEEDAIERKPYRWVQKQRQSPKERNVSLPQTLSAGEYMLFDFGHIECGFLQFAAKAHEESDIVIAFTEYCDGEQLTFMPQMAVQNVVEYVLAPENTARKRICFEPYTMRHAAVFVKSGSLTLESFGVKTYMRDMQNAYRPTLADPSLQAIYDAAIRTFSHNALDIFMDCPSRERAGWLCDSYFTGVAEHFFFDKVPTETAFLENYRLFDTDDGTYQKGVLPMCYPAQPGNSKLFIPQWDIWYVLEVEEYLTERNKSVSPELFRKSVEGVISFFADYENEEGLLENLPSWNFVEWSDANTWTQNVNYPTNFLYSEVLLAAYRLYGVEEWRERAERVRAAARARSFDGQLFTDNAVRDEAGVLKNTGNTSEACQYYALLFGGINMNDPQYAFLKERVLHGFADVAASTRRFVPVNAFIGLYLRIKFLLREKLYDILLEELNDFFGEMVEKTGTLWEMRQLKCSLDHGFASYVAYAIAKALHLK